MDKKKDNKFASQHVNVNEPNGKKNGLAEKTKTKKKNWKRKQNKFK